MKDLADVCSEGSARQWKGTSLVLPENALLAKHVYSAHATPHLYSTGQEHLRHETGVPEVQMAEMTVEVLKGEGGISNTHLEGEVRGCTRRW